ncbi:MAG: glycerophosphodiester phosphodiesterase [Salinisphaera sp.]|nr:glycerophosphodiester phosphodiesterase [Salinisphaera sp.]MDN5939345.1 glycerophosphodiester phosphodiesterase [Salinisphaera sp.]
MSLPRIIAHRGASHAQPENSAAAFDAALAERADGIECDLQYSRDGVVVVYHDHRLDRLGLRRGHVSAYDWADLAERDIGHWFCGRPTGHRMLRLEDVLLGWGSRTRLYLEIKNYEGRAGRERHHRLAVAVAAAVRRHGLQGQVEILSFRDRALDSVHASAPELPLVRNVRWSGALRSARKRSHMLAAACLAIDRFGPREARRTAALGLPLYAYTCDTPPEFRRAQALEVTAVICNGPAAARRWWDEAAHDLQTMAPEPK